jgi:hypothetical protein
LLRPHVDVSWAENPEVCIHLLCIYGVIVQCKTSTL